MARQMKIAQKKERNSNIEMLRIVSMFLIILYHIIRRYSDYTGNFATLSAYVYLTETILGLWGEFAVYLFVIISAWFQSDSRFHIKHIVSIIFQAFCYIMVFGVVGTVLQYDGETSITGIFKGSIIYIHDAFVFKNIHWFIAPFIMMCFMSPFLNLLIQKFSKRQMGTLVLTLTGLFFYCQFSSAYFSESGMFLCIYLLVGYVKRYCVDKRRHFAVWGGILAITILLFTVLADNVGSTGLIGFINNYTSRVLGNFNCVSLIVAFAALFFFLAVAQMEEKHSKIINLVGGLTFGVYLFHETFFYTLNDRSLSLIDLMHLKCEELGWITQGLLYPIQLLGLALITLILGLLVEFIRKQVIHKPFMRMISHCFGRQMEQIDNWFDVAKCNEIHR